MMRGLLMRGVAIVLAGMSVLGVGAGRCAAQAPLEPGQMPPRTLFYLIWRGMPSAEARKQNALFGLWDDADFAPMRTGMVEVLMSGILRGQEKKKRRARGMDFFWCMTAAGRKRFCRKRCCG